MPKKDTFDEVQLQEALNALSNRHRLTILIWLTEPEKHFPPQRDADLVKDGVCVSFITEKTGLSQPTVTTHMQALAAADLVTSKKIKNWVYYKPNRSAIDRLLGDLDRALRPA
ncbi:ArsR family transcriptional regulator [Paraburkholderia tropica]|uniref:ArsR/SmtB family transcription factor n=1 Tax=Paraburkholderia TaxID=1822464 RepID=UPI001CB3C1EF|nr:MULTISPECIES: helix-turn-helix domain-containing protein [Paraburkholderia]CAG9201660.1 ArsR family transcriptional regulator [Paraburkholderia tropica]